MAETTTPPVIDGLRKHDEWETVWAEEGGVELSVRRSSEGTCQFRIQMEAYEPGGPRVSVRATVANYRVERVFQALTDNKGFPTLDMIRGLLDALILLTPTGEKRNALTEANIHLMKAATTDEVSAS